MANINVYITPQTCLVVATQYLKNIPELATLAKAPSILSYVMGTINSESSFVLYRPILGVTGFTAAHMNGAAVVIPPGYNYYTEFQRDPIISSIDANYKSDPNNTSYAALASKAKAGYTAWGLMGVMGGYFFQGTHTFKDLGPKYNALMIAQGLVVDPLNPITVDNTLFPQIAGNPPQATNKAVENSILSGLILSAWHYDNYLNKGNSPAAAIALAMTKGYLGTGTDLLGSTASSRAQLLANDMGKVYKINGTNIQVSASGSYASSGGQYITGQYMTVSSNYAQNPAAAGQSTTSGGSSTTDCTT